MAKSRGRKGERVGWLRRADVDEEMWPAEQFGGVSDEQFWDDLSADKPLATKARTAQPDSGRRARTPQPQLQPRTQAQQPARAATAAFPAVAAPATTSTAAFPAVQQRPAAPPARPAVRANPGSDWTGTHPQPVLPLPSPGSGPMQSASTGPIPAGPPPGAQGQGQGRGYAQPRQQYRPPSTDDDPLTSAKYSVRATGGGDGRSYRRDPYQAQPGQNGYGSGPYPTTGGRHARSTSGDAYGYRETTPAYDERYPAQSRDRDYPPRDRDAREPYPRPADRRSGDRWSGERR